MLQLETVLLMSTANKVDSIVKLSNRPIVKLSNCQIVNCQLSLAKNLSSASSIANLGIGNPARAASSMGRV